MFLENVQIPRLIFSGSVSLDPPACANDVRQPKRSDLTLYQIQKQSVGDSTRPVAVPNADTSPRSPGEILVHAVIAVTNS
ncbi:hypothetical protein RRG08_024741 [Elysia crispata]|uniref:Uncharacterized protein n=1 Tax=Elysia crispata TaxID=231223 RepID=A0AAE1CXJ3_9GAST|nr:hypothetical protein RRG08_024741 [Elysia crispata]